VGEFDLIQRYFTRPAHSAALGVGDDCALLQPSPGMQLAISSDMLVSGRHFFGDTDPYKLGHKALAVNLSDLAACGAKPVAFTLALALPQADPAWLAPFSQGLWALAETHGCELIGGDTTQGPLNICITVFGEVPQGRALLRSGAQAGDDIYVSGTVGDARLALEAVRGTVQLSEAQRLRARLRMDQPTPRVALGLALCGIASSAIDVSDGLLGDLGHILKQSAVGARINIPAAMQLIAVCAYSTGASGPSDLKISNDMVRLCVLNGGDDYELVFTAPEHQRAAVQAASAQSDTPVTRIGQIEAQPGVRLVDATGTSMGNPYASFDHFA
jgi:thiamine-monophosphate kinase